MQTRYDKYEQLATDTLEGLMSSRETWTSFLNTAARMYKYTFDEQVLIHAQRPEIRACADFSFWTSPLWGMAVGRQQKTCRILTDAVSELADNIKISHMGTTKQFCTLQGCFVDFSICAIIARLKIFKKGIDKSKKIGYNK